VLKNDAAKIVKVAAQFDIQLPLEGGRIVIPADKKQFKEVIRLLSDDVLESPLTGDRFVAASKRKLPKKK